jgi:Ca2+-binding EF-hand superfamily protein
LFFTKTFKFFDIAN